MANEKKKIPANLVQILLVVSLIVSAYFIGNLSAKVQLLQNGVLGKTATPTPAAQPTQQTVTAAQIKDLFKKDIIKFGDSNKKLLFVEIADPSCPFCHIAAGENPTINKQDPRFTLVADGGTYIAPVTEMKKLLDAGKAAFAYIYDPGHGNGEMGAKALYCAFEKGKFWEVHDLLMSEKGYEIQNGTDVSGTATTGPIVKNDKTKSQDLADFLATAMDPVDMKACLDSGKYDNRLASDTQLAQSLGVNGTPGFFVNATAFPGAYNYKDMDAAVQAALK